MDDPEINIRIYLNEDGTIDQIVPSNYYGQFNFDFIRPVNQEQGWPDEPSTDSKESSICTCEAEGSEPHTHEWHGIRVFNFSKG